MGLSDWAKRLHNNAERRLGSPLPRQADTRLTWNTIYHRGGVDELLADDTLRRLEVIFSSLRDDSNWSVALYLLYAQEDRQFFNSWSVRLDLKKMVAGIFWKEARKQAAGAKDPEELMLREGGFSLALDEAEKPFRCRLRKNSGGLTSREWFSVDADIFLSEEVSDLTARGRFITLTRALPVIRDDERVCGAIWSEGNIAVAPHLDSSQRGVRGRAQKVYVTEQNTQFLIGPHAGCDFLAASMQSSSWITVDPVKKSLEGDAGLVSKPQLIQGNDFSLRYLVDTAFERGGSRQFGSVVRERITQRDFSLAVVARVLPRGKDHGSTGYGADWCGLNSPGRPIQVSLRFAEHLVIAADEGGAVFLRDELRNQDKALKDSETIVVEGIQYRWQADSTGTFCGYLFFDDSGSAVSRKRSTRIPADESLSGVIARNGPVAGKIALLTEYGDDELISRRGGILLESDGKGSFDIAVASTSTLRHLFILDGETWRSCNTNDVESVRLKLPGEFAFGSSRFSLTEDGRAYSLRHHWSKSYEVLRSADLSSTKTMATGRRQ